MSLTNTSSTGTPFISDEYYRWIVLLYGVVLQAISVGTIIYCFTLFTLPWLDEFGSSRRDMMLTIALLQIGAGILGPIAGRALDTFRYDGSFSPVGLVGCHWLWLSE